jgi:protein ImuB
MLWVALCFPRLALEALLRGRAPSEGADDPWAVAENRSVLVCNAAAAAAGVRPGSALSAAWALAPRLRVLPRDAAAEAGALEAIAAWACQFTSKVSLEPPQAVLLEVEGSLRLFGGAGRLMARLRSGLAGIGFEALLAAGPTARAAPAAQARRSRRCRSARSPRPRRPSRSCTGSASGRWAS